MPRSKLLRSSELPYHIGARVNNRDRFPLKLSEVWESLSHECLMLRTLYGVEFHSLVVMPNHFHAMLTSPHVDLGVVSRYFLSNFTRVIHQASGRTGRLFGGPYFRSLIQSTRYYSHVLKYVYRNPVKAGLCESVEDYPYSSIQGLVGNAPLPFPLHQTRVGMEIGLPGAEMVDLLPWLNRPFPGETESLVGKLLRRRVINTVLDRSSKRPLQALEELI